MSFLLHVKSGPRWATSEPPPNWQPQGGFPVVGESMPAGDSIGFSGQTPESITPTMTFEPAVDEPPRDGHTALAPMKSVLSSSVWLRVSFCTAETPSTFRMSATEFAGTCAATPPYTVE